MGSGTSRLRAPPQRARKEHSRSNRSLASLLCGASASTAPAASQTEDHAVGSMVNSAGSHHPVPDDSHLQTREPALSCFNQSTHVSRTQTVPKCSHPSPSTTLTVKKPSSKNKKKHHAESSQLVSSTQPKGKRKYPHDDAAGTSSSGEPSSTNLESQLLSLNEANQPARNKMAQTCYEDQSRSILLIQPEPENLTSVEHTEIEGQNNINTVAEVDDSTSGSPPSVSTSVLGSREPEDNTFPEEVTPPSLEFLVQDSARGHTGASELHTDLESIPSSMHSRTSDDEATAREARRNSRRTFWNAFSTRSSRRRTDFPAILFAEDDGDGIRSPRGWLLDFGSDFFDDETSVDSRPLGRRSNFNRERRWHSRSELLGRLRSGASERTPRNACPTGLHPDGLCSCGWDEETTYQTSISRIVMLAEALFEVLDEIHRQPSSFALSIVSNPAPESVVDSLPLKSYCKSDTTKSGDDNEQCYICLSEYENGDRIRVLPCNHEYHMNCVDKWLKDIHGVCPLCRGDVGQGRQEGSEAQDPLLNPSIPQPEPR